MLERVGVTMQPLYEIPQETQLWLGSHTHLFLTAFLERLLLEKKKIRGHTPTLHTKKFSGLTSEHTVFGDLGLYHTPYILATYLYYRDGKHTTVAVYLNLTDQLADEIIKEN